MSPSLPLRLPVWLRFVVAGGLLALVPFAGLPAFYESFLYLVLHWVVLATSWNILSGYSGYFSFGHGAFFGIGMYTTAGLAGKLDWPFLATLPAAAAIAALFGAALGAVVFRVKQLRGELFALLTLAVTFVLATIVLNTPIDGGPGVYLSGVAIPALAPTPSGSLYMLVLGAALVTLATAHAIYRSKLGTGLFAIHDDEDVAEVLGVPTYRYKLAAFAVSCALAGLAGAIHAVFVSYVTTGETFSILVPLYVVLMSVLGGTRHWFGPAIGAAIVTALLYAFTAGDYAIAGRAITGLVLVAVILFLPEGVIHWVLGLFGRRAAVPAVRSDSVAPGERVAPAVAKQSGGDPILLTARGVSRSFSGVRALDGVDVEIRRGEILGLVGPNGSGKSTLINVITGHFPPDAGSIRYAGSEIALLPAHRIARLGIARTYQIPRPFAHATVLDNVALTAMFGRRALDRHAAEARARECLTFTGLAGKADALPADLNLHQRKFLELARALAAEPALLMLDEVLSGLTPAEIDTAIGFVRAIRERGTTIVFVEHVMRAVMELTDRVVVLSYGKVIAAGDPHAVMQEPAVVTAYLGKPHA